MAQTIRTYVGTGSPSVYNVDFETGYISKSHVYVYQGDDHTVQLSYTYVNDTQIQVDVPLGEEFFVRRIVPRTVAVHNYEDGALLREKNLDASYAQGLMLVEEIEDGFIVVSGITLIRGTQLQTASIDTGELLINGIPLDQDIQESVDAVALTSVGTSSS